MRLPDGAAQDFAMRLRRQGGANQGGMNPNMGPYGRPQGNGGINPGGMYGGGGLNQRTLFPFPKDSPEGGPPPMTDQNNFMNSNYGWPRKWKPFGGPGDSINRDFQSVDPNMGPYGRPRGNGGINPGGMYGGGYGEGHTNGLPLHDRLPGGVDPNMGPYGRPYGNGGINPGGFYNGGSDEGQTNGLPLHDRLPGTGGFFPWPGNRGPIPPGPPLPRWDPNSGSIIPHQGNQGPLPPYPGTAPRREIPTENPIYPEPIAQYPTAASIPFTKW